MTVNSVTDYTDYIDTIDFFAFSGYYCSFLYVLTHVTHVIAHVTVCVICHAEIKGYLLILLIASYEVGLSEQTIWDRYHVKTKRLLWPNTNIFCWKGIVRTSFSALMADHEATSWKLSKLSFNVTLSRFFTNTSEMVVTILTRKVTPEEIVCSGSLLS